MRNRREDPPVNASSSSAGQDDEQLQNYTPVPPTSSIISSALCHPYDWRPQNHLPPFFYGTPPPYAMYPHGVIYAQPLMAHNHLSPFFYGSPSPYAMYPHGVIYAQPLMAHYHLPPFFFGTPPPYAMYPHRNELPVFYGTPPPYAMYPHEAIYAHPLMAHDVVPDNIPDIWDGQSNTSEDTEMPEGSLASGIEGYSGSEASCEGSDAGYQYGSPPRARDHQSSSGGTPQMGNLTRMNEPSQPVLGYPMTTGAVPVLPVPGVVTRCTANLSTILPTCSEITSTAVPTTSVSVPSEAWMQAMSELNRQLELGASRESDLPVKLPKEVAELEGLTRRADFLTMENTSLRAQIKRLQEENALLALNASLKVSLEEISRETEEVQHQNQESDEKRADDQQQYPESNEKRADD